MSTVSPLSGRGPASQTIIREMRAWMGRRGVSQTELAAALPNDDGPGPRGGRRSRAAELQRAARRHQRITDDDDPTHRYAA